MICRASSVLWWSVVSVDPCLSRMEAILEGVRSQGHRIAAEDRSSAHLLLVFVVAFQSPEHFGYRSI